MWFSYDSEEGFKLFASEQSAKDDATRRLNSWRDQATRDGDWSDEADTVCWGRMCGGAEPVGDDLLLVERKLA
jgi:hypothetical protein